MVVYFRSLQGFRVQHYAETSSYNVPLMSPDNPGTMVFPMDDKLAKMEDPFWACNGGGQIWHVVDITPDDESGTVTVKVESPINVFYRNVIFDKTEYKNETNQGVYLYDLLNKYYSLPSDTFYRMDYMVIEYHQQNKPSKPDLTDDYFFNIRDYIKKLISIRSVIRMSSYYDKELNSYKILFYNSGKPNGYYRMRDDDGRTQVVSLTQAGEKTVKVRVYIVWNETSGKKTLGGYRTYYLQSNGDIAKVDGTNKDTDGKTEPNPRIPGRWETTYVFSDRDATSEDREDASYEAALKYFRKNEDTLKIEFYHDTKLDWGRRVEITVDGIKYQGLISEVSKSSDDNRYFYKIGSLKNSASEQLGTALKDLENIKNFNTIHA